MPSPPKLTGRDLAERVAAARKFAGLSQAALARAVGVSRSAISQWELGRTGKLTSAHLLKVEEVTKVSARWIAEGAGPTHRGPLDYLQPQQAELLKAAESLSQYEVDSVIQLINALRRAKREED